MSSAEGSWIRNPAWINAVGSLRGAGGLVHGTMLRRAADSKEHRSLPKAIAQREDCFIDLFGTSSPDPAQESGSSSPPTFASADQVHGERIVVIRRAEDLLQAGHWNIGGETLSELREFEAADGLVSTLGGIVLIIKSADCLPILFWDPTTRIVGACHCGWRGLLAGLAGKTAAAMVSIGAQTDALEAWIGPGIRVARYEVGEALVARFESAFPSTGLSPDGKRLDLAAVAMEQLRAAGIAPSRITDCGQCTFADPVRYHSYRRDGPLAGRLLTVIGMIGGESAR